MYKVSYMGDGSTTEFTFNFPYFENSNIIVTKNGATATGYIVVGTSAGLDADIPYTGGKVVFETAPIATDSIIISRSLPLTRIVDYQPTAKIEPTVLNQDMNYTMEILKDFKNIFDGFDEKYSEIIDTESTQILISKIDTVSSQITNLGDISTLCQDVTNLKTITSGHTNTISVHTTAIESNTTNIGTLDARTNGIIDYVIESQTPSSSNNYTWYRKYKSGWVEQGGRNDGLNHDATITMPITMSDISYAVQLTRLVSTTADDPASISLQVNTLSTTTFKVRQTFASDVSCGLGSAPSYAYNWIVFGMSA